MSAPAHTARERARRSILSHALPIAGFEGWCDATLTKAAVAAGMPPLEARRLFPGGAMDALALYAQTLDEALTQSAEAAAIASMRVHERIDWLVRERLHLMEPHREAVRRAVAFSALPWQSLQAARALWSACDVMWRLAGDDAVDFNHYTKRALLAQVYASTLLHWLQDESPDYVDTHLFLQRRLADVLAFGKRSGALRARVVKGVEGLSEDLLNRSRYRSRR